MRLRITVVGLPADQLDSFTVLFVPTDAGMPLERGNARQYRHFVSSGYVPLSGHIKFFQRIFAQ